MKLRVRNFVYETSLRSVYSPKGAFLHLLSYSLEEAFLHEVSNSA